jgi:hypothetical protein
MHKRLKRLSASAESFVAAAREVNALLGIYDDELSITINGVQRMKTRYWKKLDLWLDPLSDNIKVPLGTTFDIWKNYLRVPMY